MTLKSRLARLERDHGCAGPCSPDTARPTYTVFYNAGEPIPPAPADAPTCPRCGEVHLFVIEIAEMVQPTHHGAVHDDKNLSPQGEMSPGEPR